MVFAALTMLCDGVLAITHGRTYDIWNIIEKYIVQIRYTTLWFLPCLFMAELGFFAVRKAHPLMIAITAFLLFYIYRTTINIDLPWNLDLSILALGYISLGFATRRYGIIEKIDKFWAMLVVAFTWIVTSWINYSMYGRIDWFSDSFGNPILFLTASIAGLMTIILLVRRINIKLVNKLGNNSLVFFGLNRTVLDLLFVLYGKIGISATGESVLLAIISVGITIVMLVPVHCFLLRFAPWTIGRV